MAAYNGRNTPTEVWPRARRSQGLSTLGEHGQPGTDEAAGAFGNAKRSEMSIR